MKRLLAVLLLFCLSAGALALDEGYYDQERFIDGDWEYIVDESGQAVITDYLNFESETLVFPARLGGYPVSMVGEFFSYNDHVTTVTIPDNIVGMNMNPFFFYENLTDIIVSPTHPVFTTIDGVLFDKVDMCLVSYPVTLTYYDYAVPEGTEEIGVYAFAECENLHKIILPDTVTKVTYLSFKDCYKLEDVVIWPENPVLAIVGEAIFDKNEKRLITYLEMSEAKHYDIPQGTKIIGESAFYGSYLTDITFPKGLEVIEPGAFYCCDLEKAILPDSLAEIGECAFEFCYYLTEVSIPKGVTKIEPGTFFGCSCLAKVTLPGRVTEIAEDAFLECSSSLAMTIGNRSAAKDYCRYYGIQYVYPDSYDWLK